MENKKVANPGPLGLLGFGLTTVLLSFYNAGIFTTLAVDTLSMAIFVGGFMQLVAGMLSYKKGETFSGTSFTMFGFFWLTFGASILLRADTSLDPSLISDHTMTHGLYLLLWAIVTAFMAVSTASKNHNKLSFIMFTALALTFVLLSLTPLTGVELFKTIGGVLGILTGLLAVYQAVAQVINEDHGKTIFPLP